MNKEFDYSTILQKVELIIKSLGIDTVYTHNLDPFFKGDLDGKTIYIGDNLSDEEKLFNLLHLAGHSIQWNIDPFLRNLGSVLYKNPSDELILRLQLYEWEANCYALSILQQAHEDELNEWLNNKYIEDMMYLTHFYKTGEKLKYVTDIVKAYEFNRSLELKKIPAFIPHASDHTRNGIVVAF
jgi:hypothetical protein